MVMGEQRAGYVLMAMGKTSNSCSSAITIPKKKFKRGSTGK